ncbi:hypothetical protein EDB86DRAFT_3184215 [Lactarius hatsudake]|nr:hypothetical protein EDB86DRAFT_3184215 [Lactarius hatsudake]
MNSVQPWHLVGNDSAALAASRPLLRAGPSSGRSPSDYLVYLLAFTNLVAYPSLPSSPALSRTTCSLGSRSSPPPPPPLVAWLGPSPKSPSQGRSPALRTQAAPRIVSSLSLNTGPIASPISSIPLGMSSWPNVETHTEKDVSSFQSSVERTPRVAVAHNIDERRRAALAHIDGANFSWFHLKVICVAGACFFTDVLQHPLVLSLVNYSSVDSPTSLDAGMDGVKLMIIIVGTFGQAISGHGPTVSIIGALICWRFLMGIGIGGGHPLSAVISSKFAATRTRGREPLLSFQTIVVAAFKNKIINDDFNNLKHVDYRYWRLLIGLGCLPGVVALYFRLTIPETPCFTMDIERNVKQATQDIDNALTIGQFYVDPDAAVQRIQAPKANRRDFLEHPGKWENFKVLFGAAYSWFALGIAFYGLGLNSSIALTAIGFGTPGLIFGLAPVPVPATPSLTKPFAGSSE